jgi:hypothetical protein
MILFSLPSVPPPPPSLHAKRNAVVSSLLLPLSRGSYCWRKMQSPTSLLPSSLYLVRQPRQSLRHLVFFHNLIWVIWAPEEVEAAPGGLLLKGRRAAHFRVAVRRRPRRRQRRRRRTPLPPPPSDPQPLLSPSPRGQGADLGGPVAPYQGQRWRQPT